MSTIDSISNAWSKLPAACQQEVKTNAKTGFMSGVAVGIATANPGAIPMGIAGAAIGAAGTFIGSEKCNGIDLILNNTQ